MAYIEQEEEAMGISYVMLPIKVARFYIQNKQLSAKQMKITDFFTL